MTRSDQASISPWWHPARHADRRPFLAARGRVLAACRAWFAREGFSEVEAGALQVSPGNETHLHAFAAERIGPGGERERLYLHTSPEFACKKLIAAGETRIVDFARVFRNREGGPLHASEFVMLEWYRAGAAPEAIMADCAKVLALAAEAAGTREFVWRDRRCDPFADTERLTLVDAFSRYAAIDLEALLPEPSLRGDGRFRIAAERIGVRCADDDTWSDIFSRVLSEKIEPHLGISRPTFLVDYPVSEAALARPRTDDPRFAERFELYACGVELANGFGELTDPSEQRRRFEADMDEKARLYGERYPIDEDFLAAVAAMPETSGVALGFDRLVMLAAGAPDIRAVQWTPSP